jgi:hypothetical protein
MDKSQMRVRPGFILGLGLFFVLCGFLSVLLPAGSYKTRAMIIATRSNERILSQRLCEHASAAGGLTNLSREFALNSLSTAQENDFGFVTNASGEVVDVWDMPYRTELVASTNFIIRSAGKNRRLGDKDDIVFNSVSNDFVNP